MHTLNKNSQVAMGDLDRKQDKQAIHSYVTRSKVPKDRNPEDMKGNHTNRLSSLKIDNV